LPSRASRQSICDGGQAFSTFKPSEIRQNDTTLAITNEHVATGALARPSERRSAEVRSRHYTLSELMVATAAREIRDGEVVFVGMRLPLIAFVVAKKTHAPNAIGLFENGVIRATPAPELIYTMADPPNILGATQCLDMLGVMSLLQSGRVHLGFRGPEGVIRLPGSGGACDIASLAQRFVVLLEHKRERLPERVWFLTSPGNGDGAGWRKRAGLPGGGPAAVITTKAVFRFDEEGEAHLASLHPGVKVEEVLSNTGWNLRLGRGLGETSQPTAEELNVMREYDKEGFWTG
jgi:glutaconate CoA-transferase, subunit B